MTNVACRECKAEIPDPAGEMTEICDRCLGLEDIGQAVGAFEADSEDYAALIDVGRVTKQSPGVVQLKIDWRDSEDMGEEDAPLLSPLYLTKTAAKTLATLLNRAVKGL